MQQESKQRRRRVRAEDPSQLDSAVTFYTSVPGPVGRRIRERAEEERRRPAAIIRDILVKALGDAELAA